MGGRRRWVGSMQIPQECSEALEGSFTNSSLAVLDLSGNMLTGTLPSASLQLTTITSLDGGLVIPPSPKDSFKACCGEKQPCKAKK